MQTSKTMSFLFLAVFSTSAFSQDIKKHEDVGFEDDAKENAITALSVQNKQSKAINLDDDKTCINAYYRKAKKINYTTAIAGGITGAAIIAPALPVLSGLVALGSTGVALGGCVGLAEDLLSTKQPEFVEKVESIVAKVAPEGRPLVTMPTALPLYRVADTISLSYAILADKTGGLRENILGSAIGEILSKEANACEKAAKKKGLDSSYIVSLNKNISKLEARLAGLSEDSPYKAVGQELVACSREAKMKILDKELSLYDFYKFEEQASAVPKDIRKMVQSFGKVYAEVYVSLKDRTPNPEALALIVVEEDQKFIFCKDIKKPMKKKDFIQTITDEATRG